MEVNHKENRDGSLQIVLDFSPDEIKCLKNDLLGLKGIVDWYALGPSQQKIIKCKKRMFNEWVPKLRDQGKNIPPNDEDLIKLILENPEYKDRESKDKILNLL